MPTYEYRCQQCGETIEAFQKMSDDPLEVCERCGGELRRVLHPVAIHFKGSGFYTTDYGRASKGRPAKDGGDSGGDAGAGSDGGSDGAKEPALEKTKTGGDGKKPEASKPS